MKKLLRQQAARHQQLIHSPSHSFIQRSHGGISRQFHNFTSFHQQLPHNEEKVTTRREQKLRYGANIDNDQLHFDFQYLIPIDKLKSVLTPDATALQSDKHFINLTNGLEIITEQEKDQLLPIPIAQMQFVRMQSTLLENNNYAQFLQELDHNLLMNLALGNRCFIYDYGCRKAGEMAGQARALWQGIAWVRFVLNRIWLQRLTDDDPIYFLDPTRKHARSTDHLKDFREQLIPCISNNTSLRRRLKYYAKYVNPETVPNGIKLFGVYKYTPNDFKDDFYVECARQIQREVNGK